MPGKHRPTAEDRLIVIRRALTGLAGEKAIEDVAVDLAPLHPEHDTFPAEVLLELAADALEISGASRHDPVQYDGIRERVLVEHEFRGRTEHHKSHYALRAATMIRAGVAPDLLAEVSWWHTNDLWIWSWYALVIFARVATERTGDDISMICAAIAARHGVTLDLV
jgi:hypothetical protein